MPSSWRTPNRALADVVQDAIKADRANRLLMLEQKKWLITDQPPAPPEGFYVPWEDVCEALGDQ